MKLSSKERYERLKQLQEAALNVKGNFPWYNDIKRIYPYLDILGKDYKQRADDILSHEHTNSYAPVEEFYKEVLLKVNVKILMTWGYQKDNFKKNWLFFLIAGTILGIIFATSNFIIMTIGIIIWLVVMIFTNMTGHK